MVTYIIKLNYFFLVTHKTNVIETSSYCYSCPISYAAEESHTSAQRLNFGLFCWHLEPLRMTASNPVTSRNKFQHFPAVHCWSLARVVTHSVSVSLAENRRNARVFYRYIRQNPLLPSRWCIIFSWTYTNHYAQSKLLSCYKGNPRVFSPCTRFRVAFNCRMPLLPPVRKSGAGWSLINPFPSTLDRS